MINNGIMKKIFFIFWCLYLSAIYAQNDSIIILAKFHADKGVSNIRIPVIDQEYARTFYKIEVDSLIYEIKPNMYPIREHSLDSVEIWRLRP